MIAFALPGSTITVGLSCAKTRGPFLQNGRLWPRITGDFFA